MFKILISILLLFTFANSMAINLTEKNINSWFMNYYSNPEPDLIMYAINIFHKNGNLARENALAPIGSFLSVIFEDNPEKVTNWVNKLAKEENVFSESERKIFIFALYYSNVKNKYSLINKFVQTENEKKFVNNIKQLPFMKIVDMRVISPITLDEHWGAFAASGNEKHIEKIIMALSLLDSSNKKDIITGKAATWSLTSNAYHHKKVLDICRHSLKTVPKTVRERLRKIIDNVENEINKNNKK